MVEIGPPGHRRPARSPVARGGVALAVGAGLAGLAILALVTVDPGGTTKLAAPPGGAVSAASTSPAGLALNLPEGSVHPGGTVHVTGSGCPPEGAVPVRGGAVGVRLGPRGGTPGWAVSDGTISIASFADRVPGVVEVVTVPSADGSWAADLAVPVDTPLSDGYRITALCATRLTLAATGPVVDPHSVARATVTSGPVRVIDG